jgi:hypothetical protein
MKTLAHNTPRHERGQALAEFSLILPILLLVVFGIIDFGRVIFVFSDASTALRDAARKAEILGLAGDSTPSYADCDLLRSIALATRFVANEEVDVYYWDTTEPELALPAPLTPIDAAMAEDANTNPDPVAREAAQITLLTSAHYTCEGGSTLNPNPGIAIIDDDGEQMDNGDLMRVHYTGRVNFLTPFLSALWPGIDLDFYAQRTVVTQLILGSTDGIDYDFDGLDDRWEFMWFGCYDSADALHYVDADYRFLPLSTWEDWEIGGVDWQTVCDTREVADPEDELAPKVKIPKEINTAAYNAVRDPDGDGCNMGCEENRNSQPEAYTFPSGYNDGTDTDGDGLTDGEEANTYFTSPSGGDWTYCDWNERHGAADGNDYLTHSDGVPDGYDSDCDGVPDGVEVGSAHTPQIQPNDPATVYPGKEAPYSDPPVAGWPYRPSLAYLADGADANTLFDSIDSDGDKLFDHEEYYDETPCNEPHAPEAIPYVCLNPAVSFPVNEYYTNPTHFNEVGNPNQLDGVDTDNDGLTDFDEITTGFERTFMLNRQMVTRVYRTDPNYADGDGDGLLDGAEVTTPVYGGYTDPNNTDTDGDGLSDYLELLPFDDGGYGTNPLLNDSDFDGLLDNIERDLGSQPEFAGRNYTQSDPRLANTDGGTGGKDRDGDGFASTGAIQDAIPDSAELLPGEILITAGACADMNDGYEVYSLGTNPASLDSDGDGLSDCYEVDAILKPTLFDSDGDGPAVSPVSDKDDCAPHDPTRRDDCGVAGDADVDGLQDWWEDVVFSGDMSQVGTGDSDSDLCDNLCEFRRGTDPLNPDTDGDTLLDGEELPDSSPTSYDTDGDGLHDGLEKNYTFAGISYRMNARNQDSDGDGLTDGEEYCGAVPETPVSNLDNCAITASATNAAKADSDGDGLWDMAELYPSHPDNANVFNVNYIYRNSVTTDPLVQDSDGDGWTDYQEIQVYYNWQPNPRAFDTDGDNLSDRVEGTQSFTEINNADTDGDGLEDEPEYNGFTMTIEFCDDMGGSKPIFINGFSSNLLNRLNPNSQDSDSDTLLDGIDEVNNLGTNPTLVDTENDKINDNKEVADGTDPLCGGDIIIIVDEDTDGDTLLDKDEIAGFDLTAWDWGTVVTDPTKKDSDGDTLFDNIELDGHTLDFGYTNSAGTFVDLSLTPVVTNPTHVDYNGDGQNDGLDSDLDGINDNVELAGTNSTKIAGAMMSEVDCNKDTLYTGQGEFEVATLIYTNPADRDTDDDGMPDWAEIDNNLNPLDGRCGPQLILAKDAVADGVVLAEVFQKYWQTPGFGTVGMTPAQAEAAAVLYAAQNGLDVFGLEIVAGYVVDSPCDETGILTTTELNAVGVTSQGSGDAAGGSQCGNIVRGTISELIKLAFSPRIDTIEFPDYN